MKLHHDDVLAGHFEVDRTLDSQSESTTGPRWLRKFENMLLHVLYVKGSKYLGIVPMASYSHYPYLPRRGRR